MIKRLGYLVEHVSYQDLLNTAFIVDLKILCGVYFLVHERTIVYVGQSTNITARITAHTDKIYDSVFYLKFPKDMLDEMETHYIVACKPKYNKTHECMILLNDYRKENSNPTKWEKYCMNNVDAISACNHLNIKSD